MIPYTQIMSLSPEELQSKYTIQELQEAAKLWKTMGEERYAEEFPDTGGITPYDPNSSMISSRNMGALGSNIVPSGSSMISGLANAVWSPIDTTKALYDQGLSGIYETMKDRYVDNPMKTLVEDPVGAATDFAPFAAGKLSKFGKAGKLANAVLDPVGTAGKVVAKGAQVAGKVARTGTKLGLSFSTGFDPNILSKAVGSGKLSEDFFKMNNISKSDIIGRIAPELRGIETPRQQYSNIVREVADEEFIVKQMESGFDGIRAEATNAMNEAVNLIDQTASSRGRGEVLSTLKDISALEKSINSFQAGGRPFFEKVYDTGGKIKVTQPKGTTYRAADGTNFAADAGRLDKIATALEEFANTPKNAQAWWNLHQKLDNIGQWNPTNIPAVDAMIINAKGQIRKTLDKVAPEASAAIDDAARQLDILDDLKSVVGDYRKGGGIDAINKMVAKFTKLAKSDVRKQTALREQFYRMSGGVDIESIAAGFSLRKDLPSGLVARQMILGGTLGALSGNVGLPVLFMIPAASPRLVGRFLSAIGASSRVVDYVKTIARDIHTNPYAKSLATKGYTIGGILAQMEERRLNQGDTQ